MKIKKSILKKPNNNQLKKQFTHSQTLSPPPLKISKKGSMKNNKF